MPSPIDEATARLYHASKSLEIAQRRMDSAEKYRHNDRVEHDYAKQLLDDAKQAHNWACEQRRLVREAAPRATTIAVEEESPGAMPVHHADGLTIADL